MRRALPGSVLAIAFLAITGLSGGACTTPPSSAVRTGSMEDLLHAWQRASGRSFTYDEDTAEALRAVRIELPARSSPAATPRPRGRRA